MDSAPGMTTVDLYYESEGKGPTLIVLHGLFGSIANWRPLSRKFSETYQVYTVDQRNHGRSPHSGSLNYTLMAEDLRAFIQRHGLNSAYVLGHSMGGKTAMQFAFTYPELVDKLIIVDMSPRASRPRHEKILAALQNLDLDVAKNRRELDGQLAQNIAEPSVRQFLLMNIDSDDGGRLKWRMNLKALANCYDEINKEIQAQEPFTKPTLFVRGGKSDYITDEDSVAIQTLFPASKVVTIAGAGHWVHAEAPEEFARQVLEFLKS
jgi:pimeloyl-ACP methyl ester carboxylesterase